MTRKIERLRRSQRADDLAKSFPGQVGVGCRPTEVMRVPFGEPNDRYQIVGDLTMHGVTRELTLDARDEGRERDLEGGERLAFSATANIDRRDYGLNWNQALETGGVLVSNAIRISLDVEAKRTDN